MALELLLGHAAALEGLWRAARAGRLAHFLLVCGPQGIGKWAAARALAQGLLCAAGPGAPCGECGPCKRVASGNHADLLVLDPVESEEEHVPIAWVTPREDSPPETIDAFLSLKHAESAFRIVLLRESERLVTAAQNALLKTLEEPAPGALLVLESSRVDLLLPTLRSRAVRVELAPPGREATRAWLVARGHAAREAGLAARWAGGAPGRALRALETQTEAAREQLLGVLERRIAPPLAAQSLWELEASFAGKTERVRARARAQAWLELWSGLLLDLWRARAGVPLEELAHGDALGALAARRERPSELELEAALLATARARADVRMNLAPEAALERALGAAVPLPQRSELARGARA